MELVIKNISENELEEFLSILQEVALWLINEREAMWCESQLSIENLLNNNSIEEMFIGHINNEAAAVMILQQKDSTFWSDVKNNDSLFLHKLAVRRKYAKKGFSKEMINWAKTRAKNLSKTYLRLDCAADRLKLCEFYENQGFKKVSERVMFSKYPTAFYEFEID